LAPYRGSGFDLYQDLMILIKHNKKIFFSFRGYKNYITFLPTNHCL